MPHLHESVASHSRSCGSAVYRSNLLRPHSHSVQFNLQRWHSQCVNWPGRGETLGSPGGRGMEVEGKPGGSGSVRTSRTNVHGRGLEKTLDKQTSTAGDPGRGAHGHTGFVSADDGGAAHGLGSRQITHQIMVRQHPLHAISQRNSDRQGEPLRNRDHLGPPPPPPPLNRNAAPTPDLTCQTPCTCTAGRNVHSARCASLQSGAPTLLPDPTGLFCLGRVCLWLLSGWQRLSVCKLC